MPAQERSIPIEERALDGDQPQRRHREAMARNTSPKGSNPRAEAHISQWDDAAGWDQESDEAARHRARRLLSRSNSRFHRFGDKFAALQRWITGERWVKRVAIVIAVLAVIFTTCFGGLWWRLGAGPINLDVATPWLAAAIEDNIGHGNTVEVGGTQIERAGRIRIAVRIRDIVVRDRDQVIVATAPKAEVKLSGTALLMGRLRAESLNLVDAELAVRITPDGQVTVSAGDTAKPLATGVASKRDAGMAPTFPRPAAAPAQGATAPDATPNGLLAGLDWLDSLSLTGLDGQNLNEIGLKNGNLVVDDQQRGNKWTFENISLSMRRPRGGGVAVSLGEEGARPWSLKVVIGPPQNGVRSVDLRADKVPAANILLAMRVKDLTYSAELPLSGELKGELGRDGLPTYFRGKVTAGAGNLIDSDTPDYPMPIDSAEMSVEWDAGRRVLVAPFKIVSGANRITLLGHLEPPNGATTEWQAGLSGGTILLAGTDNEPPLIFNRIAIGMRFDTDRKRVVLTQADISNGEIGIAGTGSIDYAGEARLQLGFAGTPMSASALKRMWPILIVPEVREWVIERIEKGTLQRIEVGVNSPVRNLPRKGPPIPDDGLAVNIVASRRHGSPGRRHARGARCRSEGAGYRANRDGDDRAGHCRHARRAQDQHFRFHVRGAGHGAEAVALAGEVQGGLPGAGGGRDPGFRPHQRSLRHADRSERQQGNGCRHHHARPCRSRLDDQGRYHLHRHGRPRRICRRQARDEPEAGSQHAEGGRQQRRLPGQGRRQDQRPAGLARLSQAERGRRRYQAAGDAG